MTARPPARVHRLVGALAVVALALVFGPAAWAAERDDAWPRVRASLFGARILADAGDALSLALPIRAEDAAVVPVAIRAHPAPGQARPRRLYLIIDQNPSPVAAIFEFGEAAGRIEIETRVRVEDYSMVRAIAEYPDGSLAMTTRYIKASGGCSAPANKGLADASTLGQMRWTLPEPLIDGRDNLVALLIRHPNTSGLAMDQVTRLYDPPHFVRHVSVTYQDRLVLTADVDFSISENPTFRFGLRVAGDGVLAAEAVDTNELRFSSSVVLTPVAPR